MKKDTTRYRRHAALAIAILSMLALAAPAVAELATSTWPMFGHDLRHTGRGTTNGPTGPTVSPTWTYLAPAQFKEAPPTIAPNGTIYLAVGLLPICAVNPDGTKKWCTSGLGGGAGGAAPTVGVDPVSPGTGPVIYVGGRDNKTWAIKDRGQDDFTVLWRKKILADGDVHSSALIDPETDAIYTACGCVTAAQLEALDPTPTDMTDGPGEELWPAARIRPSVLYVSPAQEDRTAAPFRYRRVYIGSSDGKLHAFTPGPTSWNLHWSFLPVLRGTNTKSSPIIGDDGTIYMGSYRGLSAVTDNGTSATNKWPTFPTVGRIYATPALSQNGATVYIGTATAKPYLLWAVRTSNGTEKWRYPRADLGQTPLESLIKVPAVVGLNGTIYVAAGRTVYAFRDDVDRATMLWSYRTGGIVLGLSLGNNALFVVSNDHKLYKLED